MVNHNVALNGDVCVDVKHSNDKSCVWTCITKNRQKKIKGNKKFSSTIKHFCGWFPWPQGT